MLSAVLVFPKGKRFSDHYSNLAPEAVVFGLSCCQHELNESTKKMMKISFINVYMELREMFLETEITFVTIYLRSTLHDKIDFFQERYVNSIM